MTIKEFKNEKDRIKALYIQWRTVVLWSKDNEFAKEKLKYYYSLYQKYCMFEENVLRNSLEGIDKSFFE